MRRLLTFALGYLAGFAGAFLWLGLVVILRPVLPLLAAMALALGLVSVLSVLGLWFGSVRAGRS